MRGRWKWNPLQTFHYNERKREFVKNYSLQQGDKGIVVEEEKGGNGIVVEEKMEMESWSMKRMVLS